MRDQIGVIIIHYANLDNVRTAIDSVLSSNKAEQLHIVVVDNNARESARPLEDEYTSNQLTLIQLQENLGFSGANNVGIRWALKHLSGNSVVLLNDDATFEKKAVWNLIDTLESDASIAAVVPKIYFTPGHEFHTGYQKEEIGSVFWYAGGIFDWREVVGFHRGVDELDRGQYDTLVSTQFATGCAVALNAEALRAHGMFDEKYFLYYEDADLSQRFIQAGWKVVYQPNAVVWHQNAGSSGSGGELHVYYQTRNRLLFGLRYAPLRAKLFLIKQAFLWWRHGTPIQKRAILDVLTHNYGIYPEVHSQHH